ncbi:spermidine synthase [soil metagenome]
MITLSEERGVRFLHFGTEWIQGAMRLARPWSLELAYTRQMMAWLLFLDGEAPGFRIGQLGLGAASLTRCCWRYLLESEITVVEIDPEVVSVAESMFKLPDDRRIPVAVVDAADYLTRPKVCEQFDVLQVDLYDQDARGPVHGDARFYGRARAALAPTGVLVVNLFGEHGSFAPNLRALHDAFGPRVVALPEIDAGNRIALAFKGPAIELAYADLYARAADVEQRFGLAARRWVDGLRRGMEEGGHGKGPVLRL